MKRCVAALLSVLLMMTSVPMVGAESYNDDWFDWGEYACPHTETEEVAEIPSTCLTQGRSGYTRCAECKWLLSGSREPLPLGDHTYDNLCDADCNVCGALREVGEHEYVPLSANPPTCVEDGVERFYCIHCGDSYSEVIKAEGHKYDDDFDAECNVCGEIRDTLLHGDADGDGKVNNRDLGILQRYINEWDITIQHLAADMNGDGKINNRDLGLLQRLLNRQSA